MLSCACVLIFYLKSLIGCRSGTESTEAEIMKGAKTGIDVVVTSSDNTDKQAKDSNQSTYSDVSAEDIVLASLQH